MNLHLLSFALSNSVPICQPMAKRRSKRSLCLDFHRFTDRDFCIIAGGCRTWCRHGGHKGMGGIVVMKFILATDHLRQGGCLQKRWIGHFSHEKGTTSSLIHILKMGGSTITRFRLVISSSSLMTWPSHAAFWSRSWWEDRPLLGWQADDELLLLDVVIQNHVRIMPGV